MPRKPRPYLSGMPCHVIQRGNNRQTCFFAPGDYRFYLDCLRHACRRYQVQVHAYVLMTNHVHMLLTPADPHGISLLMQSLGRRYVQRINQRDGRSGTMWEGRHKACLVDADAYLLACQRYIELNPVRARIVDTPGDYRWSSFRSNAFGEPDPLITPHPTYQNLGENIATRRKAYRELVSTELAPGVVQEIGRAIECSKPLGDTHFAARVAAELGRGPGHYKRGRPRKSGEGIES